MNYFAERIKSIRKSDIRKIFDSAPAGSINLGLGEIQFPTPKSITEYAKEIIDKGNIPYTPNAGLIELREAVADYYYTDFCDNVCITVGAEEALFTTLFCYLNPGDEVMLANPTFLAYKTIIEMVGGKPVYFDLDPDNEFKLIKKSFIKKITSKTKMVILNNPSNPLGIRFEADEIGFIIKKCIEENILILVDEVYRELFLEKRPDSFMEFDGDIIVVSSLSKSHCMTGWRLGWAISKKSELIEPIINIHQFICTCAPFISQKAAIKALSEEGFAEKEKIRKKLVSNRKSAVEFIEENIPDAKILSNSSSPYLFINFNVDDILLTNDLLKEGVIVISGSAFGSNGKNWIRISYAVEKNMLIKGLKAIRDHLNREQ